MGAKSSAGNAWDAWDEKFPRKSKKDWQSQLSKFANVMLAAALLQHRDFKGIQPFKWKAQELFFQEDSELFTVSW